MSSATITKQRGFVKVAPDKLVETIGRFLLMKQTKEDRDGREILPSESRPLGNSYCNVCRLPCFVVPEKQADGTYVVLGELKELCDNCEWLQARKLLVE